MQSILDSPSLNHFIFQHVSSNHEKLKILWCQSPNKEKMAATRWASTAVPFLSFFFFLNLSFNSSGVDPSSKKYTEVTSYPQRTSRGLPHTFFVQIKRGPVKQNRRAQERKFFHF